VGNGAPKAQRDLVLGALVSLLVKCNADGGEDLTNKKMKIHSSTVVVLLDFV